MSNIYTSADQLIGKTPLLELTAKLKRNSSSRRAFWQSWNISIPAAL